MTETMMMTEAVMAASIPFNLTQDMMDEDQMLMSDDESAVESHRPTSTTSEEKKEIEKFLAVMRKKDMR